MHGWDTKSKLDEINNTTTGSKNNVPIHTGTSTSSETYGLPCMLLETCVFAETLSKEGNHCEPLVTTTPDQKHNSTNFLYDSQINLQLPSGADTSMEPSRTISPYKVTVLINFTTMKVPQRDQMLTCY